MELKLSKLTAGRYIYLIDEVLDGAGKDEIDLVHIPAEPVCHLSHLVRPDEVDCRVDHPAHRIMQTHQTTIFSPRFRFSALLTATDVLTPLFFGMFTAFGLVT